MVQLLARAQYLGTEHNLINCGAAFDKFRNRDAVTTVASTFFLPSPQSMPAYYSVGLLVIGCLDIFYYCLMKTFAHRYRYRYIVGWSVAIG